MFLGVPDCGAGRQGNAVDLSGIEVGRTSWSAADVLVGLLGCVANGASRTGTSGAAQESRPTLLRAWFFRSNRTATMRER
jgi:hypothetical protein